MKIQEKELGVRAEMYRAGQDGLLETKRGREGGRGEVRGHRLYPVLLSAEAW